MFNTFLKLVLLTENSVKEVKKWTLVVVIVITLELYRVRRREIERWKGRSKTKTLIYNTWVLPWRKDKKNRSEVKWSKEVKEKSIIVVSQITL